MVAPSIEAKPPTPSWEPMVFHKKQMHFELAHPWMPTPSWLACGTCKRCLSGRWYRCFTKRPKPRRFCIIPAGRRSGKTAKGKRCGVTRALVENTLRDCRVVFAAPTNDHARHIFWDDVKAMIPDWMYARDPHETRMEIRLKNGAMIDVAGLDEPKRIVGSPIDYILLDEYADMKAAAWTEEVRPALDTRDRMGYADLIGVPEGRNHYYDLYEFARNDRSGSFLVLSWATADINPEAAEAAKHELDERTYRQEYLGEFVEAGGRAYYTFVNDIHAAGPVDYDPTRPIYLGFDFNVEPGVLLIGQPQPAPDWLIQRCAEKGHTAAPFVTAWIDEVFIESDSRTVKICEAFLDRYAEHPSEVHAFGDASGGARHTSQNDGTDWELIRDQLRPIFGGRYKEYVKPGNPSEKSRVNALNASFMTANQTVSACVDKTRCPKFVRDLEGVKLKPDQSIDKDKKKYKMLTHLSDAAGYVEWMLKDMRQNRMTQTFL